MFDDPERLKTLRFTVADAKPHFEALLAEADARGYLPSIVSAVRTCVEQGNLAQTKAKRSWHVFGRAVDIELRKGAPKEDPARFYRELGEWWEARGGTWGGRWTDIYPNGLPGIAGGTPGDLVHFQWTPAPLTTGVPQELWPKGASCELVSENAARYLATGGELPSSSAKKKVGVELACCWWLLGQQLRQRLYGPARDARGALLLGEA
jgi:hypothetical protein